MSDSKIVIGSRGSDLALWQAHFIEDELNKAGHSVEIKIIKTRGDAIQHLSFDKMEGKGFFTKELETALLEGDIDMAVHSYKDLETTQPEGLCIGATSYRASPVDTLLIRKSATDTNQKWNLALNGKVGTSSARRKMQVMLHRPDVVIDDIRGNVPTRVQKLRDGHFDAIVMAKAGLDRLELNLDDLTVYDFDPNEFIPAPAQGALALQIRTTDNELKTKLAGIHNAEIAEIVEAERKVLNLFQGGCQLPLGAYCTRESDGDLNLIAIMAPDLETTPQRVELKGKDGLRMAEQAVAALKKKA